jgi:hypothetical protein
VTQEKDHKATPAPQPAKAPGAPDASDLERTRELPPGSLSNVSWPRPSPRSVGPAVRGQDKPASSVSSKAPVVARPPPSANSPHTAPSQPPGLQKPALPSKVPVKGPAAPLAPDQPSWGVEELSGSLLLPDDGLSETELRVEELSGSVLIEDSPDGGPPVVTRVGASSPSQKQGLPAHRTLLGLPELPKSTPGPGSVPTRARLPWEPDPAAAPMAVSEAVPATESPPAQLEGQPPAEELPVYRLDDSSSEKLPPDPDLVGSAEPGVVPSAPPEPPAVHRDDVEVTALPRGRFAVLTDAATSAARSGFATLQAKLRAVDLGSRRKRPPWFWPAVVVPALALGAGFVALVGSLVGTDRKDSDTAPVASVASAVVSSSPRPVPLPPAPAASVAARPAPAPAAAPATLHPCVVGGSPVAIAPSAVVGVGVEARPFGEDFAIGFARDEHEAVGMRLNARSLTAAGATQAHSKDPIRRVRPVATSKGALLVLAVDADRKGDRLSGRRTLPVDPPLQVGAVGSSLVWSRAGGPAAGMLWPLDGEGDVEALRGATEGAPGDTTTAIAFRRGSIIWLGTATGYKALAPKGDLAHIDGLGTAVGSPAIALNDGVTLSAWADRASSGEPWSLRWVRFKAGDAPGTPRTFTPPPGGQGGQAMSPGLAAVPGGRFLLVWTEGPTSFHHVRALTLSAEGAPVGSPLEISADGANAGQGQAAVGAAGTGLVAFLESADGGFRVVATPILCGE